MKEVTKLKEEKEGNDIRRDGRREEKKERRERERKTVGKVTDI